MLDNIKVGPKLIGGLLVVSALMLCVGVDSIFNSRKIAVSSAEQYAHLTVPSGELARLATFVGKLRVRTVQLSTVRDQKDAETIAARIDTLRGEVDASEKAFLRDVVSDPAIKARYGEYEALRTRFDQRIAEMKEFVRAGRLEELAPYATGDAYKTGQQMTDAIVGLSDDIVKGSEAHHKETEATVAATRWRTIALLAAALLISIGGGLVLARGITRPLGKFSDALKELGRGHLGTRLHLARKDEFGEVAEVLDRLAEDLSTMVGVIKQVGDGDLSGTLVVKDERDEIAPSVNRTIESLRGLIAETQVLSEASVDGCLGTRGAADRF